jgi:hypothetical protein
MITPNRDTLAKVSLMIEFGPKFRHVLFSHECVEIVIRQMTLSGYPYIVRINPKALRAGEEYRRVDIHIYDAIGSKHEPVVTTGLMNEIAACTKAITLLRKLVEARKADDAAWAQFYSGKGSYADKIRRRFL